MIPRNLRHLRLVLAVAETGSLTLAAGRLNVSQPAVTQAIAKVERAAGGPLFDRTAHGVFPTARGEALISRLRRAFALLDPALADLSPRLVLTATAAQLKAVVAVREAENVTLAARRLGLAQPTVHRAVAQLDREAACALFEPTSFGRIATRHTRALAQAARLAFRELDQAQADLAEFDGGEAGRIVIGALPLARSVILPRALTQFRRQRPRQAIRVTDGLYDDLLGGLRRGEIDLILGALRSPAPIGDIVQERLFDDRLTILAGTHHPLVGRTDVTRAELRACQWVVPRRGAPTRAHFDAFFADEGSPDSIIEAGSILLMREILGASDHLGCISSSQARAELDKGLLARIEARADWPVRPIGLTSRQGWAPTQAQRLLLGLLRAAAAEAP